MNLKRAGERNSDPAYFRIRMSKQFIKRLANFIVRWFTMGMLELLSRWFGAKVESSSWKIRSSMSFRLALDSCSPAPIYLSNSHNRIAWWNSSQSSHFFPRPANDLAAILLATTPVTVRELTLYLLCSGVCTACRNAVRFAYRLDAFLTLLVHDWESYTRKIVHCCTGNPLWGVCLSFLRNHPFNIALPRAFVETIWVRRDSIAHDQPILPWLYIYIYYIAIDKIVKLYIFNNFFQMYYKYHPSVVLFLP